MAKKDDFLLVPESPETKPDPAVSYANVLKATAMHGIPVGVVHVIAPNDEHITSVHYFDGWQTEHYGLALGFEKGMPEEREHRVLAMKCVLQLIPSLAINIESDFLCKIGCGEDFKKARKEGKSLVWAFRAPDEMNPDPVKNCTGFKHGVTNHIALQAEEEKTAVLKEN